MRRLNIAIITIISSIQLLACTTAVVSGRATVDGRPLLLKNRDSDALQNRLVYFFDGKFKYIGLVNSEDKNNSEVWSGFNSAGFGIMNSVSYNLKGNDTTTLADQEGKIMKMALDKCSSLKDFEDLLNSLPKPLGVEANFGVIDAYGGAAYYEVNNFHFIKFDANDPKTAPDGYLIRTNFSFAGAENKGEGYIRYTTASGLFRNKMLNGKISSDFIINDVPRCLVHSFTGQNLASNLPGKNDSSYFFFRDFIPRSLSTSATAVQGVRSGEDPSLCTMWSIVGFPLTSVIIPVWITSDGSLPKALTADESGNAPICEFALDLKDRIFPVQNDAKNYIKLSGLMNKENTGLRQKLIPFEQKILSAANEKMEKWRKRGSMNNEEAVQFYKWIDEQIMPELKKSF